MGGRGIRTNEDGEEEEEEDENELKEAEAGTEDGWLSADELPRLSRASWPEWEELSWEVCLS